MNNVKGRKLKYYLFLIVAPAVIYLIPFLSIAPDLRHEIGFFVIVLLVLFFGFSVFLLLKIWKSTAARWLQGTILILILSLHFMVFLSIELTQSLFRSSHIVETESIDNKIIYVVKKNVLWANVGFTLGYRNRYSPFLKEIYSTRHNIKLLSASDSTMHIEVFKVQVREKQLPDDSARKGILVLLPEKEVEKMRVVVLDTIFDW